MRVVSLGSGSSGNALFVEAGPRGRTKLLVDAGLSGRLISGCLRKIGVHPSQLTGVLITHEHSDHTLGLPFLMGRYHTPLIADERTYTAITEGFVSGIWRSDSGALVPAQNGEDSHKMLVTEATLIERTAEIEAYSSVHEFSIIREERPRLACALPVGTSRLIDDIEVTSFPVSHDAAAPCGFLLSAGGCRICIVTDSGEVTETMLAMIKQADLLILESNHDRQRLLRGPYPYSLKMRILSPTGHLSNDQAADAVIRTWRADSVRWLWLSHLSRTNNTPTLALRSMRERLKAAGANLSQIHISVSPPDMGGVWDSTQLWHAPSLWEMQI